MDQEEQDEPPPAAGEHASGSPGTEESSPGAVDIAQLAARVRTLMQDELRLEKARGAGAMRRTQNG
jgi:hypothetical protein